MVGEKKRDRCSIPLSDPIADIVVSAVILIIMLRFVQILRFSIDGSCTPLFNIDAVRAAWFVFVGHFVLTLVKSGMELAERRYTFPLAWMTLIVNLLSFGLTYYALIVAGILNQGLFDAINGVMGAVPVVNDIFANIPAFIVICTFIGMSAEAVSRFIRAGRCRLTAERA